MKKVGIFYGSSTGTTRDIAMRIAAALELLSSDVHDVSGLHVEAVHRYDVLVLGTPTWGIGELQDDWDVFLPELKKQDLSDKIVAIFGTGDSSSYSDTFCDGMGTLYRELQPTGCTFCGEVSADSYIFDDSTAVIDGYFVGLPMDEINETHLTDVRINQWVELLKKECLG